MVINEVYRLAELRRGDLFFAVGARRVVASTQGKRRHEAWPGGNRERLFVCVSGSMGYLEKYFTFLLDGDQRVRFLGRTSFREGTDIPITESLHSTPEPSRKTIPDFPHKCGVCGNPAYYGFHMDFECSNGCHKEV